jgi:hypothetical protein
MRSSRIGVEEDVFVEVAFLDVLLLTVLVALAAEGVLRVLKMRHHTNKVGDVSGSLAFGAGPVLGQ